MRILGISAYYHDSAAALIDDGRIIAAAQEERFSRKRHDASFPGQAIRACLAIAGISAAQLDHVVFYDKPLLKFERLLDTYLSFAPRGFSSFRLAMPLWMREKLFFKRMLLAELRKLDRSVDWRARLLFSEHHLSHAASAFYPSPFDRAAVLTMDGVGEWATTSIAIGSGRELHVEREIHFPDSLGLLYSAITYHLGFRVNSGEYKVMGLAPYGTPRYAELIRKNLIDIREDGSFRLDQRYFDYATGLTMTSRAFDELFGRSPRRPDDALEQHHADLAASIQVVLDDVVARLARTACEIANTDSLCLAGGVALNCVSNAAIVRDGRARRLWVQPAAGDAGGAIGAALAAHHLQLGGSRATGDGRDGMNGALLGPSFNQADIERRLTNVGARYHRASSDKELVEATAEALANGAAVGWFQGRMEFGPRALGSRSILADPRQVDARSRLNLKIKFRESFRPFAPAILREDLEDWFDLDVDSPYMLLVAPVRESHRLSPIETGFAGLEKHRVAWSDVPAVTHVDYSARVQTVDEMTHPLFAALLREFKRRTGCPILVNTSFNVRGEPIVCTPEDAFRCFMGTEIEYLAVGHSVLRKEVQDASLVRVYHAELAPD